jgi:excisionase family DNA binding protein
LNRALGRILGNIDLDLEHYEDGQIVFNIHLKQIQRADMLDSKKVCHMLQVSRSFLSKLVKAEQIKSYKIGKLRRFLLEDILEYLSQGKVLQKTTERAQKKSIEVFMEEQLGKQPVS